MLTKTIMVLLFTELGSIEKENKIAGIADKSLKMIFKVFIIRQYIRFILRLSLNL